MTAGRRIFAKEAEQIPLFLSSLFISCVVTNENLCHVHKKRARRCRRRAFDEIIFSKPSVRQWIYNALAERLYSVLGLRALFSHVA
jgi:hypothetical protein